MAISRRQQKIAYVREQLALANKAVALLAFSYQRTQPLFPRQGALSAEDLIQLEALTTRFSRLADILLQKVLRGVDILELADSGTLIDRLHQAEKRGLIHSAEVWITIRELRNQIAHDYVVEDLAVLFEEVVQYTPMLLDSMEKITVYLNDKRLLEE